MNKSTIEPILSVMPLCNKRHTCKIDSTLANMQYCTCELSAHAAPTRARAPGLLESAEHAYDGKRLVG